MKREKFGGDVACDCNDAVACDCNDTVACDCKEKKELIQWHATVIMKI